MAAAMGEEPYEATIRRREMLAAKREENIRKREKQRLAKELADAKAKDAQLVLQHRRDAAISKFEERWMLAQEQQRLKDDAMVVFIRAARERRAKEREIERQELAELAAADEKRQRFLEL